jgi:hypothetical protein
MMFADRLIASGVLLRATEQPQVAMIEDVLPALRKVAAFPLAHSGSVKMRGECAEQSVHSFNSQPFAD